MTRLSNYLLSTEKLPPADAQALSHKLLVRAGMVRQVGSGLWSYMPAGWRVQQRVEQIIREEMNVIGALEMLMPVLQPADLWQKTGRADLPEVFKLTDRKGTPMVLAMTHEETVTMHVASLVRSYRDLPLMLYHLQVKERDEPRPRAGILRTREFIMKDSYSFDRDPQALAESYAKHITAYDKIFDRCGLEWYRVQSDVGMMGGLGAHEYMAPCAAGENEIALAPGFAANVEIASADAQPVKLPPTTIEPQPISTPGLTKVDKVAAQLGLNPGALIKAYPVVTEGRGLILVLVRGDHQVNEIKLANALAEPYRAANQTEISTHLGPPGFIGPVNVNVPILLDLAVQGESYVTGANEPDTHLQGVKPGRDFNFEYVDVREVVAGDTVNGYPIEILPAIEIGNIFKLGTRYSEPLKATYLDEQGETQLIWMGSYGIGPARIAAAAVEQLADEQGICWPKHIAPFDIELLVIGKPDSPERKLADKLYADLQLEGKLTVLYDDRDLAPGEKFADGDLIGCPLRITIGKRTIASGELEVQVRKGRIKKLLPLTTDMTHSLTELWESLDNKGDLLKRFEGVAE